MLLTLVWEAIHGDLRSLARLATREPMEHETTRPSLLLRVRDPADQTAWREFEATYRNLISRYCLGSGLQPTDRDDVCQLVWLNLAKGLRTFKYDPKRGRFRSYLRRVVRNAIAHHFSRHKRNPQALDTAMLSVIPENSSPDELWEKEWVAHHYRTAMATVRATFEPKSVQIFDRLLAGDSARDAAQAFGTSEQGVRKVKERIRKRLRELIDQQIRDEDQLGCPGVGLGEDPIEGEA